MDSLNEKLRALVDQWQLTGLPGRQTLLDKAGELQDWKKTHEIPGLWVEPPGLVTATLDDAWGLGVQLIEQYALILGMNVFPLGLEKSAQEIIASCHEIVPDYLGMTILQFDSEEDLSEIKRKIPDQTRLIVGGPVFLADPEMAQRVGVHFLAKDLIEFLNFFIPQPGS